jgi:hypothetical protein
MVDHTMGSESLDSVGLDIQGDGNTVNLSGGIDLTLTTTATPAASIYGMKINGNSSVTLSGHSQLDTRISSEPASPWPPSRAAAIWCSRTVPSSISRMSCCHKPLQRKGIVDRRRPGISDGQPG